MHSCLRDELNSIPTNLETKIRTKKKERKIKAILPNLPRLMFVSVFFSVIKNLFLKFFFFK